MSYYCCECELYVYSNDIDRYGRHWCSYSRKYEEANQNTYGCRGFIPYRRAILTKICEILDLPEKKMFEAFDNVRDKYVAREKAQWLTVYQKVAPEIVKCIDSDENKVELAQDLMDRYIQPSYELWKEGKLEEAAQLYMHMVCELEIKYCVSPFTHN